MKIQEEQKSLLTVHSANAFQLTSEGVKSDWQIRENETNVVLCRMPNKLLDNEVFNVLDFAKKYELEGFNEGINFQKQKQNKLFLAQIAELNQVIELLKTENERLVVILENHLPKEV